MRERKAHLFQYGLTHAKAEQGHPPVVISITITPLHFSLKRTICLQWKDSEIETIKQLLLNNELFLKDNSNINRRVCSMVHTKILRDFYSLYPQ